MRKYFTIFQLSFQNEFVYRLNFVLWRLRNVLRILMTFFLWNSIFSQNKIAFGYTREQMMTYVFLVLIVNTFVIAAPSNDNIGGEIGSGDLNNFLVKPIGYLRYWITRDWASKLLNILFAMGEVSLLWMVFKPNISFSSSLLQILLGVVACIFAAILYFLMTKIALSVAFWAPENTWGFMFIIWVCMETLSGSVFPLNVLSSSIFEILKFTPFPYLIYYPIIILLGKLSIQQSLYVLIQALIQISVYYWIMIKIWKKGLKVYGAYNG